MSPEKTAFFVLTKDPTRVQGNTEKHYLSSFLATRSRLHVFAPLDGAVSGATNHSLPVKGIKGAFVLNVLLAPYWLYQFYIERPDIVYCYQNVILPALLGRYIFGATVAFDIRSDPYDQTSEFFEADERSLAFKLAMRVAKLLHVVVLQRADYVFVLSEPLADSVVTNYGVDRAKLRLLPLGVDTDRFHPSDESYDRLSIVYVGSLSRYRGVNTLLEAAGDLPPEIQKKVQVDLYGSGPENYISDLISHTSKGSPLEVHWHGLIPHNEIPERVGRSDIAVSPIPPYKAYQVSSPAKVFEYLALGLPVVASRIAPHERILDEGENALLFEPESTSDLSEKLEQLIRNEAELRRMSESARSKSLQFSWEERFSVVDESLRLGC